MRAGIAVLSALILLVLCGPVLAQDLKHPRELGLPAPGFERPNPDDHRLQLENGLTVYVFEDRSHPIVNLTAFLSFGTADDLKPGAAEVLLRGLRNGPQNLKDFHRDLYNMGAEYHVNMSAEETEISLSVSNADLEAALGMLAGVLRSPAISDPRTHPAMELPLQGSMEQAVAVFREHMLGSHPIGSRPEKSDFDQLKRSDVSNFMSRVLIPSRTVLAVSGDFAGDALRGQVQRAFGEWMVPSSEERARFDSARPPDKRQVVTIQADKLQGWVVMGHELPSDALEDWAALQVMNYILGGGHFDTRLFRVTRDQRGLTNDDSGFLEPYLRGPGLYSFRTYGRPEVVRLLIELTLQEINRIRDETVTEEELFVAKGALIDGNYAMDYEDAHAAARSFAQEWMRFGNHDHSEKYPEQVRAVTAESVQAAARKYLHPERFQIVVVGPIDEIEAAPTLENERQLSEYGSPGSR